MPAQDDTALVTALRSGDQPAFDTLMREHGSAVYRYAWSLADSPEQVEDLVQETFLTLWRRRGKISLVGGSVLPWLLTTCRYLTFNANRRQRKARTVPLDDVAHALTHEEDAISRHGLRWVTEELALLSEVDRKLLEACVVDGQPYDGVARRLGLTVPAARKRVQRVRARLRTAQSMEES